MAIENPGSCEHCARFTMKSLRRRLARQASLSGHNSLMSPSPVPAAGIHPCRAAHHGSFIMGWTAWRLRPSAQCVQHGRERRHFEEEGQSDFLLSEEEEDFEDSPFLPPAHTAQPLAAAGSMEDADGAPSPLLSVDLQDVCKRGSRDWTSLTVESESDIRGSLGTAPVETPDLSGSRGTHGRGSSQTSSNNGRIFVRLGGIHEGRIVNGRWGQHLTNLHINYLEMLPVFLTLKHFLPFIKGHRVLVRTDNTTVVAYLNWQGGLRSLPLHMLARKLILWSNANLLSLRVTHVHGVMNKGADLLSRGNPLYREWKLNREVVEQIWGIYGRATVDLFTSHNNAQCPLFFSLKDQSAPLGIDALAHEWPRTLLYAFPPITLISPTL